MGIFLGTGQHAEIIDYTKLFRGHAHKRSAGINRKSRISYPGPGFLSSATWPSLPKKHYNGFNQTKPKQIRLRQVFNF